MDIADLSVIRSADQAAEKISGGVLGPPGVAKSGGPNGTDQAVYGIDKQIPFPPINGDGNAVFFRDLPPAAKIGWNLRLRPMIPMQEDVSSKLI
jgi:hypothetical protein